jgi:uncharacterized protein DUF4331
MAGPIQSLSDPSWNSKQFYQVTVLKGLQARILGRNLACPPCNVGILSTPDYEANLGQPAVHTLPGSIKVFAGQRAEEFYVDLGSIFDLGNLRPLQEANVYGMAAGLQSAPGVNTTDRLNVHSIAIQVPISQLTAPGHPTIGVWTTASRQRARVLGTLAVRAPGGESGAGVIAAGPVPGRVPAPGRARRGPDAPRRPGGNPADRHPVRPDYRLHQLHRPGAGGHAPASRPELRGRHGCPRCDRRPDRQIPASDLPAAGVAFCAGLPVLSWRSVFADAQC